MYNCIKDTYTCDLCGFEMEWDASDLVHGEMWGCEKCGDTFCSKCFIDRHGRKEYMKMMQDSDLIYCPVCYEEVQRNDAERAWGPYGEARGSYTSNYRI